MSDNRKACEGYETRKVRTTEHMEECFSCGQMVRSDLIRHPFFGFLAGCPQRRSDSATGDRDA